MASTAERKDTHDPPRYGDYPELFWDMKPEEPILADHPMIVARLLREGSLKAIFDLVPFDVLERQLPELVIPEHTRLFWSRVLEFRRAEKSRRAARA
ncbi:MAG TPA: hypothetical protein VF746_20805 [Longimicrobium sp.]|jgi:hypothetical protein